MKGHSLPTIGYEGKYNIFTASLSFKSSLFLLPSCLHRHCSSHDMFLCDMLASLLSYFRHSLLVLSCLLLLKVDPTALERGAKALKQLDSSPNAARAFEVIKLQEMTKQKELQKEMEQVRVMRSCSFPMGT